MEKHDHRFNTLALIAITAISTLALVIIVMMMLPSRITLPIASGIGESNTVGQAGYAADTCGCSADLDACIAQGYDAIDCRVDYNDCVRICSEAA